MNESDGKKVFQLQCMYENTGEERKRNIKNKREILPEAIAAKERQTEVKSCIRAFQVELLQMFATTLTSITVLSPLFSCSPLLNSVYRKIILVLLVSRAFCVLLHVRELFIRNYFYLNEE
jgi:spore maturation protein CgeB